MSRFYTNVEPKALSFLRLRDELDEDLKRLLHDLRSGLITHHQYDHRRIRIAQARATANAEYQRAMRPPSPHRRGRRY